LCEVCRAWADASLCATCLKRFAPTRLRCIRCALPLQTADGATTCATCQRQAPAFRHTVCVADYEFPWNELVTAFKFQGRPELAACLAPPLATAIRSALEGGRCTLPDLVAAVPLSNKGLAERGYNQAWELARAVARTLHLAVSESALLRPLSSAHQIDLGRAERQRNLRSAFMVDPLQRALIKDRTVALVDDVMTTGATAQAATEALLRSGAAAVDIWVVARTPEPPKE